MRRDEAGLQGESSQSLLDTQVCDVNCEVEDEAEVMAMPKSGGDSLRLTGASATAPVAGGESKPGISDQGFVGAALALLWGVRIVRRYILGAFI